MKSPNLKVIKNQRFFSKAIDFELWKYQRSIKWAVLIPGIRSPISTISDNNCSTKTLISQRRSFKISAIGGLMAFPGEVPLVFNHGKNRFSESGQPPPHNKSF